MRFAATIEGNLAKIDAAVARAARRQADVVLFPECATTGYSYDFGTLKPAAVRALLGTVADLARQRGIYVLIGSPVFQGQRLLNCLVAFGRDGRPIYCDAKRQLTLDDRKFFTPGNGVALFEIDCIPVTNIICHERRYPELVRLACMAGARVLFHPNAGLDALAVSRRKHAGADGIPSRAFENAIYYVFANSVGPQGGGRWSAGDTKIIAPDMKTLAFAGNAEESMVVATLDISKATGKYPTESLSHPAFLSKHWKVMVEEIKDRARDSLIGFDLPG